MFSGDCSFSVQAPVFSNLFEDELYGDFEDLEKGASNSDASDDDQESEGASEEDKPADGKICYVRPRILMFRWVILETTLKVNFCFFPWFARGV